MKGILSGLKETEVATDPMATDPRLRGRTYAIPFDDVWTAATRLAGGELRGWRTLSADDREGLIEAAAEPLVWGGPHRVSIQIGLDENAQTRVDALSRSHRPHGYLGRNRRIVGRFFRRLDRSLAVEAGQILDPTVLPAWLDPS